MTAIRKTVIGGPIEAIMTLEARLKLTAYKVSFSMSFDFYFSNITGICIHCNINPVVTNLIKNIYHTRLCTIFYAHI
jgi:hypothetical protein